MKVSFVRWFLLLTTALIAMGLGWYYDHWQLTRRYEQNAKSLVNVKYMNTGGAVGTNLELLTVYKNQHDVSAPPTIPADIMKLLNDYHDIIDTMITIFQGQQQRLEAIDIK